MIIENKKKITKNLIPLFEEAGSISLKLRKEGLKKEIKNDNTPVTNGDIQVNNLLTSKIKKITPNIPIVSEEDSANKSNQNLNKPNSYIWISQNQMIELIRKRKIDIEARLLFGILNIKETT